MLTQSSWSPAAVGPTVMSLVKFSFATCGESALPVPWTHLSEEDNFSLAFDTIKVQASDLSIVEKRTLKVLRGMEVLVRMYLHELLHGLSNV